MIETGSGGMLFKQERQEGLGEGKAFPETPLISRGGVYL
jgi:hypothetical protein